jgi:hypothetical protein
VLTTAGFSQAELAVGAGGRTIAIAIATDSACTATAGDEARIVRQIEQVAPFLNAVTVRIAGSGQSLSSYVSAHCSGSRLPAGPGRVVYRRTDKGFVTTSSFTVRSQRWSVDFENDGSFFAAFVLRYTGKPLPRTITSTRRASGSRTFAGPGTFRLRISGSGRWTVRVRDGA